MNIRLESMENRLESMDNRLVRVESEIVKLNLVSSENTRAILRLADEFEKISNLHDRVTKLESIAYK
jgi:hypothetical protein